MFRNQEIRTESRFAPESIYGSGAPGEIAVPKYGPSLEQELRGGRDTPSTYARVLTLTEIERLQRDLRRAENELLQREFACRVCDETFRPGLGFQDVRINKVKLFELYTESIHRSRRIIESTERTWYTPARSANGTGLRGLRK